MKIIEGNGSVKVITDEVELASCYLAGSYEFDSKFGSVNISIAMDRNTYEKSELRKVFEASEQVAYDQAVKNNPKFKNQIQKVQKISEEVDDNGNPTGRILIKVKNRCKYEKDGQLLDRKINVVDCKNNVIEEYENLTAGTRARVSFTITPYYTASTKNSGISCWLNGMQVIKPVFYGGSSDFDETEGYVAVKNNPISKGLNAETHDDFMKALDEMVTI